MKPLSILWFVGGYAALLVLLAGSIVILLTANGSIRPKSNMSDQARRRLRLFSLTGISLTLPLITFLGIGFIGRGTPAFLDCDYSGYSYGSFPSGVVYLLDAWCSASGVGKANLALLVHMLSWTVVMTVAKLWQIRTSRRQSNQFLQTLDRAAPHEGLEQLLAIAREFTKSPLATAFVAGLAEFKAEGLENSSAANRELARRHSKRAGFSMLKAIQGDVSVLAGIAVSAPIFGAWGTVDYIIYGTFRAHVGSRAWMIARIAFAVSEALLPLALSILVATAAWVSYKHLLDSFESFELEIDTGADAAIKYSKFQKQQSLPSTGTSAGSGGRR